MVTLMILVGATWMGLYLAKRITRPVQMLAHAAREIGAGHLDQRVEPQSDDEFGALTEAFNAMAGELATSRRKVERSTIELERKHLEVERRRRYIETILERITTGVVSVDAGGAVTTVNGAAARLLSLNRGIVGQPALDRVRSHGSAGAGGARWPRRRPGEGGAGSAGDLDPARGAGIAPGRRRDGAGRRRRRDRRRRPGARRCRCRSLALQKVAARGAKSRGGSRTRSRIR